MNKIFQELEKITFDNLTKRGIDITKSSIKSFFFRNFIGIVEHAIEYKKEFYATVAYYRKDKLINPKFYSSLEKVPYFNGFSLETFSKEAREWYKIENKNF